MRAEGCTYQAIADHFGAGLNSVYRWVNPFSADELAQRREDKLREYHETKHDPVVKKHVAKLRFARYHSQKNKLEWRARKALATSRVLARRGGYIPCLATIEEVVAAYQLQRGNCAMCDTPEPAAGRRMALDHSHATGAFRGWLCTKCNHAIGLLGDDPERAAKMLFYYACGRGKQEITTSLEG